VEAVQTALNSRNSAGLRVDGKCGPKTIAAIKAFQGTLGHRRADGRIDPGGPTASSLFGRSGGTATEEDGWRPPGYPFPTPPPVPDEPPDLPPDDSPVPVPPGPEPDAVTGSGGGDDDADPTGTVEGVGEHDRAHEIVHAVLDGTHVVGTVAELATLLSLPHGVMVAAEILGPIGSVAMIALMGIEIADALETGEKIMRAQGVCYGIMYEITRHSDVNYQRPDWPFTDEEWASQLQAWREGLRDGRRRARDRNVRGRIQLAIVVKRGQGSTQAEWEVLNALWQAIRPRLRSGHLTAEWLDWPSPAPYR
jgi:peptidoglycan hydrolase-like protein with peptidoglycan-binding domain